MKKILALVLAMLLVLGMTSALAAGTASIKVKDAADSTHSYKVYQIFKGTLDKDGKLSDITFGANYEGKDPTNVDAIAEAKAYAESAETAREFATRLTNGEAIDGEIKGDPIATLTAPTFTATGLDDGYYLIIDDTNVDLADGDMYSRYIVQVSGTTEIAPKKSTVEEDKKITADEHNADTTNDTNGVTTGEDISDDQKADDLSIGEKVTYTIDAKIPLSAADYDKFFFVINDTLSEGLTFLPDTVNVYYNEIKDENKLTGNDYTLFQATDTPKLTTGSHTFEVAIKNAKARAGQTIYVVYQAELNEHAKIGEIPNTNKTTVTYSNNPEHDYDGEDENNDGKPDEYKPDVYGESPERETKTFTSSIQILKVDENNRPLQGAEFEITGTSVKTVLVTTDVFTEDAAVTEGHYYLLKTGKYTTTAPTTEDTYEALPLGVYEGGYVKNGNEYVVATYDQLKDGKTQIYRKVLATTDQYEYTNKTYTKTHETNAVVTSEQVKAKAFVDENGLVKFDGLGSGTYTITETTIPAGYNGIAPFTVTIGFDKADADQITDNNNTRDTDNLVWFAHSDFVKTNENTEGTIAEIDSNNDGTVDTFQISVKNNSGSNLPETGGIGTTIFYVAGSILVLAAVIFLVTKRRMNANND